MDGTDEAAHRLRLALFGALAGLACWYLSDMARLPDWRLFLFCAAFAAAFFATGLAMATEIPLRAAGPRAAIIALPLALLATAAGLRYDDPGQMAPGAAAALLAAGILAALIPVPFFVVRARGGRRDDYPALFATAWRIAVRMGAAWLFTGLSWLVLLLCNALLQLVGVGLLEAVMDSALLAWLFTGTVLGLGLAVVSGASGIASPDPVMILGRVLLLPILAIVLVFLGALPLRGLEGLFGDFTAAGTLIAIAAGAICLLAIAVERGPEQEPRSPVLRGGARALALCVPLLGGIALYAIGLRIRDHGLTPERVAALTAAALLGMHGLLLAAAALAGGRGWMRHVRRANLAMAVVAGAVAVLWMTPVLDAERLSARDQLARFLDGRTDLARLPLAEMHLDWGRAGRAAIARLRVLDTPPGGTDLQDRIATVETLHRAPSDDLRATEKFLAAVPRLPAGHPVPDWFLRAIRGEDAAGWLHHCAQALPEGPGCALIFADLDPARPGEEVLVVLRDGAIVLIKGFAATTAGVTRFSLRWAGPATLDAARVLADLHRGAFAIGPSRLRSLQMEGGEWLPLP